jgi:two-component system, OmpR family, phosphate regulon sensor histidine kinase PhoR
MLINSRAVALLLAICISVITTSFLSLVQGVGYIAFIITATISFSSSFLLSYLTLEFLIFREIRGLYEGIDKINRKEFKSYIATLKDKSANPIKRVNQEIVAYATAKQQEIDELKKLEVFRREFIADISHELKTPIFAAQGFVLTLLEGAVDDENVRYKFLKKAAKSLEGLNLLVQDLLTLSQIESGDMVMQFENFDMVQLTKEVFEQLEEKAQRRNVALITSPNEEGIIFVNADYSKIMQVMTNLVSNGIKYGIENGIVEIEFAQEEGLVQVIVKDNGHGIPKEHLKRIFERFYRVEKSRSRQQGGTGLGLAIVKHILQKHNVEIQVSSEVGKGTTFGFRLKAASESLVKNQIKSESY